MKTTDPYQVDGIWRIDGVEICSTGIEYRLATGPKTFTADMLADAMKAANDDVAIKPPRIKLGHGSNYNETLIGDAEQAFGRVENLVMSENKQTILGDYVGTPEWLATVLPVAYPSRSIEGQTDVETVTGKQYEPVITAVSLLGVRWPGCSVLEDLPLWYGSEVPDGAEIDTADSVAAGGGMNFKSKSEFEAAVDVSLIRRQFYNDGPGAENWQYWIRGERFDSSEGFNIIADNGDGSLSRYPVEVDGADVTFGDPVVVTEEYPDKALAAQAVLAGMAIVDTDMVVYASRAESPDQPTREEHQMDEAARLALAAKLGLPEDATEGQINAKMAEQVIASEPGEGEGEQGPPVPPPPGEGDGEGEGEGEGNGEGEGSGGEGVEAGTVTLDRATFNRLRAGSDAALEHEKERKNERIAAAVDAAVSDGRIPPARRDHWVKLLAADFDGVKATLDGLEPGLVPVAERGSSGGDNEGINQDMAAGLPEGWFPEIAGIRAQAQSGRRVLQAKEG